jgi:membrane-bound ClpP family serine protease
MPGADMTDEALVAFLRGHTDFRNRVASIALAMENAGGDLDEADAAEERLVEEMRHLGREALQGWAEKRVEATEQEIRQRPSLHRQGKKNSAGTRNSAT